jgi:hypothetical protein
MAVLGVRKLDSTLLTAWNKLEAMVSASTAPSFRKMCA